MSLFIVFEGLDGAGLSTQAQLLKEFLLKKGKNAVLTKEQTDGAIGGLIKSILKKEFSVSPLALQLLFTADRAHHLASEIEPALKEGKFVICDRYIFSTLAFGSLSVDMDFLKYINSKFRKPDLTFIIDTPPEVCLERLKKVRFHLELFENKGTNEKIRENYLALKNYFPNVRIIKGDRSISEIAKDIQKIVLSKLK